MSTLFTVVLYLVVIIAICSVYIRIQNRKTGELKDNFALGGRSLSTPVVGISLALTGLGAAHVFGLMEMSYIMGVMSVWFIFGMGIIMVVICMYTGALLRKYECASMGMFMSMLYGEKVRLMIACATSGVVWGFMTLEAQGLGIVFEAFTGYSIKLGIIIGAIISLLYVWFGGMKEIGYVNVVNSVIMYFGVVIGVVILGYALPEGRGWDYVNNYLTSQGDGWMLSIFGNWNIVWTFGIPLVIATVFSQVINQSLLHSVLSAKNVATVRKSMWFAIFVNVCFGVFTIGMGMAARSIPEFAALGPKIGATRMLIEYLPQWALIWLLASFVAAIVSSYAMVALGVANIFTRDIYVPRYKPNATEQEKAKLERGLLIPLIVTSALVATFLPTILAALGWLSSFLAPVFFIFLYGMYWKRSENAAIITIAVAWIVNMLWSLTPLPGLFGLSADINAYVTVGIAIVLGAILTAALPGKPAFVTVRRISAKA